MNTYRVRERAHEELLEDLLLARGVSTATAGEFLEPDYVRDSHDPFLLPDMQKAVERILHARDAGEKISVWSDYDCDGIPGGVMLTEFLRTVGLRVRHYIPHRHKEGYGLNVEGLDELAAEGITLVITIDLGTTEHENIAYAKKIGIDIIVTDHHIVSAPYVAAFALINPKHPESKYPFDGLCGAGVAWKLVQALIKSGGVPDFKEGQEKWYLDLVGIATLCDMVPLVGENRMLASFGLQVMRKARRPGLSSLLTLLRIKPATLTEDDIGFMIGPRINAASRMDSPDVAARLLAAKEFEEGATLARQLNKINDERKGVVAATVKEINKRLLGADLTKSPLIVMGNPNWRPGVLGLVASSLVGAHGKTVFLWGREGGEVIRGSCRSDGNVNVVELMQNAGDIFEHFGGHHASGGFSVAEEKVHDLAGRLQSAYDSGVNHVSAVTEVVVDRTLTLEEIPFAMKTLKKLAPFGVGNQKPLFMFHNIEVTHVRPFGKTATHLEVGLASGGAGITGMSFFATPASYTKKVEKGSRVNIVGHVETDWKGSPRIRIVDVV